MKLIKAIRLHWKLRIRQEYACNKVCEYTQIIPHPGDTPPYLSELSRLNKAVANVEKKIPDLYFIISDLFGGARRLKKQCKIYYTKKENEEIERWKELMNRSLFSFDLVTAPATSTGYPYKK